MRHNLIKIKTVEKSKLNVILDYDKLNDELKEKVRLKYPSGFYNHIIEFTNKKKLVNALRLETEDKIYMIRLSKKMVYQIIEDKMEFSNKNTL